MSNFAALGVMIALWIANAFLIVHMDRWVNHTAESIVSGVIRGVPVSVKHRRRLLQVNFVTTFAGYGAVEAALVFAWILLGRSAGDDAIRLLAYLFAFLNATGALSFPIALPVYYRHLASVLRDAKAG